MSATYHQVFVLQHKPLTAWCGAKGKHLKGALPPNKSARWAGKDPKNSDSQNIYIHIHIYACVYIYRYIQYIHMNIYVCECVSVCI